MKGDNVVNNNKKDSTDKLLTEGLIYNSRDSCCESHRISDITDQVTYVYNFK